MDGPLPALPRGRGTWARGTGWYGDVLYWAPPIILMIMDAATRVPAIMPPYTTLGFCLDAETSQCVRVAETHCGRFEKTALGRNFSHCASIAASEPPMIRADISNSFLNCYRGK
eukprot:COSAG05_NODE_191_length_14617_cov_90.240736_2_plen_114_part_00